MSFSDFLELKILDHVWGNQVYTPPVTIYVALSTADPGEAGASIAEPSGGAYARIGTTNNDTNWPDGAAGAKSNGTVITFAQATAAWGTITHAAYFDAVTGGNFLGSFPLDTSKIIATDDTPSFGVGVLGITLT